MSDVVVTVPMSFTYGGAPGIVGLDAWIAEGDAAGDEYGGDEWCYRTWGSKPNIHVGERVYVVCEGRLRGYAPLVELIFHARDHGYKGYCDFIRGGGAVAITIPEPITGFRGWRYRWWDRSVEVPFPDWRTADRRNKAAAKPKAARELFT